MGKNSMSFQPWLFLGMILIVGGSPCRAQEQVFDQPSPREPRPLQPDDAHRSEAVKLYALGFLCEHRNELLQAIHAFEEAATLDTNSAAICKALIPLYLAAERSDDALRVCRKAVELDPDDYEVWFIYACQLKDKGLTEEATTALTHAVACPGLKKHRDLMVQMYFDLGMLYENAQDVNHAEAAYHEVVKVLAKALDKIDKAEAIPELSQDRREEIESKVIETCERMLHLCLQTQHFDQAVSAYQEIPAKVKSRAVRLNYPLAQAYVGLGRPEEALRHLEAYLQTQPAGTDAYELRNTLLHKLGRDGEVLASLKVFASRDAHNVALQLLLARQYALAGQTQEAETLYKTLADDSPAPDIYRGLFSLYKGSHMDRAVALFDRAIADAASKEHGPNDAGAATRARAMLAVFREDPALARELVPAALEKHQDHLQPETRRLLAVLASRSRQNEAAEKFYRECLDSHPSAENEFEVYFGLIHVLWEAHKHEAVVEICRRGLKESQPGNRLLFHRNLALALALLGKASEALNEADEAIKLTDDQNRVALHLTRAEVLRTANRYQEAEAECMVLLKGATQPADIRDIRYTLSNIYSAAHEAAKSEDQLRLILRVDPNDATASNDLGYVLADQNRNLPEAEDLIRQAIKLDRDQKKNGNHVGPGDDQDHAAYIDSLGWVLFRRGQLDAAREQLEKAVSLPDGAEDPVVWNHLGDVYFQLGEKERAKQAWRKAVTFSESDVRHAKDQQFQDLKHKLEVLEAAPHS